MQLRPKPDGCFFYPKAPQGQQYWSGELLKYDDSCLKDGTYCFIGKNSVTGRNPKSIHSGNQLPFL